MKKRWKHNKNSIMRGVLTVACAMLFFVSQKSVCFAEATGTIKAPSAYVRKLPDKNSEPVGSTSSGKTVTLISQTTDASGYVWYEVRVSGDTTGYIRSDLVDVDSSSGTIPTSSSSASAQSSEQPASTASGAEILPETGMDAQYATIKVRSANVRSAASTNKSVVGSLPQNTQVIVTGQTEGSDKTWYYITFTGTNGEEKTGYVRSDMITLGEMVPVEEPREEEPQEVEPQDTEPEVTVNQDYELRYEYSEALGKDVWYIYDWTDPDPTKGTKQNLEDVLTAAHAQSLNNTADAETVSKQRIVIIVLIAVIIILAVVMTIMIFKLRDVYYEEYEDDEDEEEDRRKRERRKEAEDAKRSEGRSSSGKSDGRSEKSERRREREEREEREEPVRRKSSSAREERQPVPRKKSAETDRRMPEREVSYEEEAAETVKSAPKKKAKNFMIDDDDFEFEFLNMKNKDKDI